ncbi:hypothetical protein ACFL6R_05355 [Gemmatimonadota bacterium]
MKKASSSWVCMLVHCLVFFSAVGCGKEDSQGLSSVAWESIPAIVDHSDHPLPPPWYYNVELEIGSDSGDEDYLLRAPFAISVLPGGSIVIGDDKPLELRAYDLHGNHLASFGQPGGGPADLTPGPFGWLMRPTGEQSFQLWSGWPPRIQEWTISGELLTVETIASGHPIMTGMTPRTLAFIEDDPCWIATSYTNDSEDRTIVISHVLVGDVQGAFADTLTSFPHEPIPAEHQMIVQFGFDYAHLLKDHILISQDDRCYITSWLEDWIMEIDLQRGIPVSRFRWAHEPDSVPESEKERIVSAMDASGQEMLAEGITWLQKRISLLGIAEGPDGQVLVQRTGAPVDDLWPTDVFSAEGEYLGRVMLPVEPRLTVIRDRQLFGIGTDHGIPVIRVLHISPS